MGVHFALTWNDPYTIVFINVVGLAGYIENLLKIMTVKVRNLQSLPACSEIFGVF